MNRNRILTILSVVFGVYLLVSVQPVAAATKSWSAEGDWDNSVDQSGVVHDSFGDLSGNDTVQIGYPRVDIGGSELETYLPLDENSGSTAKDIANGNDGTIDSGADLGQTGTQYTDAVYLQDGEDITTSTFSGDDSSGIAISFWVKFDQSGGGENNHYLIDYYSNSGNRLGVLSKMDGSNNIGGWLEVDGTQVKVSTSTSPTNDVWKHYIITANSTHLQLYEDGDLLGTKSHSQNPGSIGDGYLILNDWQDDGGNGVDATYDDPRVYDRHLTKHDVQSLYNSEGYIETQTKTFSNQQQPDLETSASIPADTSITIDIIGSPNTASEEIVSQTLDGSGSYSLSWSNSHTDFRINATLSTNNITKTPNLSSVSLEGQAFSGSDPPIVENNSATPTGGTTIDSQANPGLSIDIKDPEFNQGDSVTVDFFVDGSQVDSKTISSNQTVTGSWSNPKDGGHSWSVNATDSGGNYQVSETFNFDFKAYSPILSNGRPDGSGVSGTANLKIDINDRDFGVKGSDSITVDFYGNGSFVGSDTLSSNGTASTDWDVSPGGTKYWYANTSDSYGLYTNSSTFTIKPAADINFYNETAKQLIDNQTISVEFDSLDSGYETTKTTSDGTMQLPLRERFHISVNSSGYVDNTFYIFNHSQTHNIALLPVQDPDEIRYEQCFVLEDKTGGNFPEQNSRLYIYDLDRAFEFQNQQFIVDKKYLMGNGYFGGNNLYCEFLVHETIYLLEVRNSDGDIRQYGTYTAVDDGAADRIAIGEFAITNTNKLENKGYAFQAGFSKTPEQNSPAETDIKYIDRASNTSYLNYTIYEVNRSTKNGSILDKSPVYTLNQSDLNVEYKNTVDLQTDNKTYLVNYTLKRGGEKQNGSISLQDIPQIGDRLPIDKKWLDILGYVFIVLVGGLLVPSQPRLAGMGMSLSAILLTAIGVVSIPVAVLGPAAAASLLFLVAGDEVV